MPKSPKFAGHCQSCLMPFEKDTGVRENPLYCSLCYKNGDFQYKGDYKPFEKMCYEAMVRSGMPKLKAKIFSWSIRFAPRWKSKTPNEPQ
jgi:hypothetical protein